MGTRYFARRTILQLAVVVGAVLCQPAAFAAFFLDLSALGDSRFGLALKSDTPVEAVESIDIELRFDFSALELVGEPTFKSVLAGPDFKLADCGQRLLAGGRIFQSSCGGFFDPMRVELTTGELVSWLFEWTPDVPETTFDLRVTLGEDDPIQLSKVATPSIPIPEPGATAFLVAGLGLLGFAAALRRGRLGRRD